ncbi:MAG: hypothetical protein JO251_13145, partial [Verrucomicrobia bacterium]|nr:hypothetical protein [Verrucomicrobiota bacterium]MBV8640735.1 hypothetical protein [Verrucomicrobiota bacterium]
VQIHENLIRIKIPTQAVAQTPSRPAAFLATVADEDLPAHLFLFNPEDLGRISKAQSEDNGVLVGEIESYASDFIAELV